MKQQVRIHDKSKEKERHGRHFCFGGKMKKSSHSAYQVMISLLNIQALQFQIIQIYRLYI